MTETQEALLIREGNELEDAGQFGAALERYDAAVRLVANSARAHLNRGNALQALGDITGAESAYATALVHNPNFAAAHFNLGNAYVRLNRRDQALACYRRALSINPDFVDAEVGLGALFEDLGQHDKAAASYKRALQLSPSYAAVHSNLGNALQNLAQLEPAVASYQRALELDPQLIMAQCGMGNALQRLGRHDEAVVCYQRVLQGNPDFALALGSLGSAMHALGRNEEAVASYRRALQFAPLAVTFHNNLGNVLFEMGNFNESLVSYRSAVDIAPDLPDAHYNLGRALVSCNRIEEGMSSYRQALILDENHAHARYMLGNVLKDRGQLQEALECYRRVVELEPKNANAYYALGNVLAFLSRTSEAIASYQLALDLNPDFATVHSNLLFLHNYEVDQDPADLVAEARRFGEMAARLARPFTSWPNVPRPDRVLRIGFVSGDLRSHPVGYFLDNVLAALASRLSHKLELYAYSNHDSFDDVSARIKDSCSAWYPVADLPDEALATQIRDDHIDILIDLSGHSAGNRLPMFAWKPAPIQVTWLGYLATTGVEAIDYVLADTWTMREGNEALFTEKIWRLPQCYLCFTPPIESVDVGTLPALRNRYVTFGSFNKLTKMNDAVVALWSRVLAAVPGSRLFLKSKLLNEAPMQKSVIERFVRNGIDERRLILEGPVPRADYLKPFRRMDIALDPFPYCGITTSVESLFMGVPVLTLAGQSFISRQGVGLLMNAELADWIATDADDYVARAASHASDLPRLAALRTRLREQVLASPIFDAPRFASNFESALRGMWQRWCKVQHGAVAIGSTDP